MAKSLKTQEKYKDRNNKKIKLGDPLFYKNKKEMHRIKDFGEFIGIKVNNNRLRLEDIQKDIILADPNKYPEHFI